MVRVRDKNRIPAIMRQIKRMNERKAVVGVFDDAPNLVRIAQMNEFGVDQPMTAAMRQRMFALAREHGAPTDRIPREGERFRVPERSFLRAGADESEDPARQEAPREVAKMMAGEQDAYETLMEIGKVVQRRIIDKVARGDGFEPLDPFTVAITGESRPLIGKKGVFETTQGIRVRVVRR